MNVARRGDDLAAQQLTVDTFPAFYNKLVSLQFPLAVSDVIEIRGVINQADRKSTRLNSSHSQQSRMPSSA